MSLKILFVMRTAAHFSYHETTVTHLVARLYDVESGAVRGGGHDVRDVTLQSLEDVVGYVTQDAMRHVAELIDVTPAEVYGTASFYEMFRFEPTGKYLINICGTMSCALMGGADLMHHAEHSLGIRAGSTTSDGLITLQHAECQAACTEAPTLQVNYRHRYRVTPEAFDELVADLRAGKGRRQLSMVYVTTTDEAAACAAAGIDVLSIETSWSNRVQVSPRSGLR